VFVGWGSRPYFSEHRPGGAQIFSGTFHVPIQSYRAYRFNNWAGNPQQPPAVAARRTSTNHYNVYASWNGSTRVPPAQPEITLEDLYTAHALTGVLAAQDREPDPEWVCRVAERIGLRLAQSSRKRRARR
jgi:hypothetical protein